jgi:hypothetical protein
MNRLGILIRLVALIFQTLFGIKAMAVFGMKLTGN